MTPLLRAPRPRPTPRLLRGYHQPLRHAETLGASRLPHRHRRRRRLRLGRRHRGREELPRHEPRGPARRHLDGAVVVVHTSTSGLQEAGTGSSHDGMEFVCHGRGADAWRKPSPWLADVEEGPAARGSEVGAATGANGQVRPLLRVETVAPPVGVRPTPRLVRAGSGLRRRRVGASPPRLPTAADPVGRRARVPEGRVRSGNSKVMSGAAVPGRHRPYRRRLPHRLRRRSSMAGRAREGLAVRSTARASRSARDPGGGGRPAGSTAARILILAFAFLFFL